ncbi:hypothetical protein [Nocardioides sp. AE5]|uniref:hypothetical protein n=1 Tax=Nocardioides sp. AE5 TaxID=2962573 RepID=UPI002880C64A|nr:hypothetical protein [Nocardioides sp. AE5]MDT0202293.1 hypothetical protein [Nocardioides sp. AE5]
MNRSTTEPATAPFALTEAAADVGITCHWFTFEVGFEPEDDPPQREWLRRVSLLQVAYVAEPALRRRAGFPDHHRHTSAMLEQISAEADPLLRTGLAPVDYELDGARAGGLAVTYRGSGFLFPQLPLTSGSAFVCWRPAGTVGPGWPPRVVSVAVRHPADPA